MKLTDEQIDKLFQEGAAKESFAYKPEYWESFSASLSDNAPLSDASDEALDTAFQESAANQSFDYKPEFWETFAAGLPENAPLSQASDGAFDAAFQDNASAISVDYNPAFWNEFSDSLSSSITATENVTDHGVDAMYREEAANLSFVYQPSYWEDMAAMLRRRRRRPEFLWFGLSSVFATALIAMLFLEQSPLQLVWDTPEYTFGEITPGNPASQNRNLASNNSASNGVNNVVNQGNDLTQGQLANRNASPQNSNAIQNQLATNGNVTPVSSDPNRNNGLNTNPTLGQTNPNSTQGLVRMNRITPQLILTASYTPSDQVSVSTSTVETIAEVASLETRTLESTDLNFDNVLAETNYPKVPKYRGGIQSGIYVQGLTGVSQSLIANSDALSTSYGLGLGWQIQKRNWTFNVGSNLIVENFSNLTLSGSAYRHVGFSGGLVRNDYVFNQIITSELDLGIGYNVGRHQFRAGIRPSFAVSSYVRENQILSVFDEDGGVEETLNTSQGFNNTLTGIQRLGLKPSIGYAYNFPSSWTIGLSVSTELMSSVHENLDYVIGTNNTLPLDGQLYIRKTLNFRK